MGDLDKRELQLNSRVYSILIPPPTKGMPIIANAAVTLAPILGGFESAAKGGAEVLLLLMRNIEPSTLNALLMDVVEASKLTVDGTPICTQASFDKHFMNCYDDIYPVCFWALLEVVGRFFPALVAFAQGFSQQLQKG